VEIRSRVLTRVKRSSLRHGDDLGSCDYERPHTIVIKRAESEDRSHYWVYTAARDFTAFAVCQVSKMGVKYYFCGLFHSNASDRGIKMASLPMPGSLNPAACVNNATPFSFKTLDPSLWFVVRIRSSRDLHFVRRGGGGEMQKTTELSGSEP